MVGLIARQLLAHPSAFGFAPAAFDIADDTFERFLGFISANPIIIGDGDFFLACAEQNLIAEGLWQFAPRLLH